MNILLIAMLCLGTVANRPPDTPLPAELAPLAELYDDETALVNAMRAFDREQQGLIAWDGEMRDEYVRKGQEDLAREKHASMKHRVALIQRGYEEVLYRYPENAAANNYFGELCYDYLKDYDKAIASWRLAVSLDDTFAQAYNNLGIHYSHKGQLDKGVRYLEKAIELDPNHPDYHYNIAQIFLTYTKDVMRIKEWSKPRLYREAMKHSRKAAELNPDNFDIVQDYAVNFFAADQFGAKRTPDKAAKAWQAARALAVSRDSVFLTWLNEARVWLDEDDFDKAEPCLLKALEIRPDSGRVERLLKQGRDEREKGRR